MSLHKELSTKLASKQEAIDACWTISWTIRRKHEFLRISGAVPAGRRTSHVNQSDPWTRVYVEESD